MVPAAKIDEPERRKPLVLCGGSVHVRSVKKSQQVDVGMAMETEEITGGDGIRVQPWNLLWTRNLLHFSSSGRAAVRATWVNEVDGIRVVRHTTHPTSSPRKGWHGATQTGRS
jgi:hypothetical protein